jgi:D-cysteine desulfhydrase
VPESRSEPELFRVFPNLRLSFPRRPFCDLPTPVEPFPLDGVPEGGLWIKRDDRSCAAYGGNKPRKLEFILAAALARGSRRLVTSGGLGTNHGLATTILGRQVGLATTLVLVPQPVTASVQRSLLLDAAYGAELVYAGGVPAAVAKGAAVLAKAALRGERPFLVPTGGSSRTGELGFVSAGLELGAQVRAGEVPEPAEIWLPVGSGGSLAGLVAGLRLAGLASRVVGVLVTDILPPSPRSLARAARGVLRLLRRGGAELPALSIATSDFELVRDQLGPGYGAPTPAGGEAVAAAARCDIRLETTYTGKALAALRERASGGPSPGRVRLFWNTHNSVDPTSAAPLPIDPSRLPPRFRRIVENSATADATPAR